MRSPWIIDRKVVYNLDPLIWIRELKLINKRLIAFQIMEVIMEWIRFQTYKNPRHTPKVN